MAMHYAGATLRFHVSVHAVRVPRLGTRNDTLLVWRRDTGILALDVVERVAPDGDGRPRKQAKR